MSLKPLFRVDVDAIQYDADEKAPKLPDTLQFVFDEALDPEALEEAVSDRISEVSGYCHKGFSMTLADCVARDVFVEFAEDHYKHFGCYPGDVALEDQHGVEAIYGFDSYMALARIGGGA
ncbi:hypothetical protein [Vreelandella massiliensis]|uniref:hypothetical protein n=1 Tax=Vreelandella massiliensis TaxID=1816686 RepID=UPI00096A411F|nr:hypothetical protein [Halomonas massiliensis]